MKNSKAKDFFINLGAIVGLYTIVYWLIQLLFTVINTSYPQITDYYVGTQSISRPVAILIVFFPIFIVLMWLLEKDFTQDPDKRNEGIHKWLTYITLFIAWLTIAWDLITVLYYFIDGQELAIGFILKVIVLLVIAGAIFWYYLTDALDKGNKKMRIAFAVSTFIIVTASISWGFVVLWSPATQRLYKYDDQKTNDLTSIYSELTSYYANNGNLPADLSGLVTQYYYINTIDQQSNEPYEYNRKTDTTYELCAVFNKASRNEQASYAYGIFWSHPEWKHCFPQTINPNTYAKPIR
jgi:hypothetical protein